MGRSYQEVKKTYLATPETEVEKRGGLLKELYRLAETDLDIRGVLGLLADFEGAQSVKKRS